MKSSILLLFFFGWLTFACQSTEPTAALELEFDQDSPWEYYREKYDIDGDGRVSEAEYDENRGGFARLDRSGDGHLEADDFASSSPGNSRDMRSMEIEMRAMRALFEYLQEEGETSELTMDELFYAAEAYDQNGDEVLAEVEFRTASSKRFVAMPKDDMARMMGERDPWESLVSGIDENADGTLSFPEFESFFEQLDGDFILSFEMEEPIGGTTPRMPQTGPRVGSVAPDFELAPTSGGEKITLSSFTDERPVALIFGSYT